MRASVLIFLAAAGLSVVLNGDPTQAQDPTRVLEDVASRLGANQRLWVPAAEIEQHGWHILPPAAAELVERAKLRPDTERLGCISIPPPFFSSETAPPATFTALLSESRAILHGTVRSIEPGFLYISPGSLMGIHVIRVLKADDESFPDLDRDLFVYLFFPSAGAFDIGSDRFCLFNRRLPFLPEVGDEIVLFPFSRPVDRSRRLIYPFFDEIATASAWQSLSISGHWIRIPQLQVGSLKELVDVLAVSLGHATE